MRTMTLAFLSLCLSILLAACTNTGEVPPRDFEEEGLDTIRKDSRSELYIRPDIALPLYHELYIEPITVSYSSQKHNNTPGMTESDFQFDENELARFQEQFHKAVSEIWTSVEGRTVIDELPASSGDDDADARQLKDTLIMRATVTDLYLNASIKNNKAGRNTALVDESSKMVINMDLLDAATGEVLIRSKDRRTTGYRSGPKRPMSSVTYFNDVYQSFRQWINQLAARLD